MSQWDRRGTHSLAGDCNAIGNEHDIEATIPPEEANQRINQYFVHGRGGHS